MMDIKEKYRLGRLGRTELRALADEINSQSDAELAAEMEFVWNEGDIDSSAVSAEQLASDFEEVKRKIAVLDKRRRPSTRIRWISAAAAAAAVLVCALFMTRQQATVRSLMDQNLLVRTEASEKSSITLPDGTVVKMNELSELRYCPGIFGKKERNVALGGEAFFNVTKSEGTPFYVRTGHIVVRVYGTRFNVYERPDDPKCRIALEEGSVSVTSLQTGQEVMLSPQQEALIEKNTGRIEVQDMSHRNVTRSWTENALHFNKARVADVIAAMESAYDVKIELDADLSPGQTFTGHLPDNDLVEALDLFCTAYGISSRFVNHTVYLQ